MPILRNSRWEAFAQGRASGLPAAAAYRAAGYRATSGIYTNSARLLANAEVRDRIDELQEIAAREHVVTRASLVAELDQAIALAHERGQASAAIAGVVAKAKMLGLEEPKPEHESATKKFENMTQQEIEYMWAEMLADIRAAKALLPAPTDSN